MPFREIVGHRRILSLLARAIEAGTLPPSLIFAGPEGVGKRLAAQAVAQALNCNAVSRQSTVDGERPTANDFDACGRCATCNRIARGVHPDVQTIAPGETGSIKVDQVREAIDRTVYRPFEGKRRVTVIEDADALMASAQNALLKTLEEPPSSSVFILVTSRPDALLSTVRSRCSTVRFPRLSPADVAAVLERDHKYQRRDALAAAAAADGSVRRALDLQAGELADARSAAGDLLRAARGKGDARMKIQRAKDLLKGGGSAASEREHLGVQLQALASLARDLGVLATGADTRLLANLDLQDELEALRKSFDAERALQVYAAVGRAQDALDRNVGPKVVADWLALQI
jgi:DNA polymerase-3 subunit delta'